MQIVWQVSSQSPVVGLRHEVHYKVVWVYVVVRTLLRVAVTDFFHNFWWLEFRSDNRIRQLSRCVSNHVQNDRLEAFYDFYVWNWNRALQWYFIRLDWFEYCFVYEIFSEYMIAKTLVHFNCVVFAVWININWRAHVFVWELKLRGAGSSRGLTEVCWGEYGS
jgi:hypothetical protein